MLRFPFTKPLSESAYIHAGNGFWSERDVPNAIKMYELCLHFYRDSLMAAANLANVLVYDGQAERAFALVSRILPKQPDDSYLWDLLGRILEKQNRIDGAVNAFVKSIELNSESAVAYYRAGSLLAQQKRYADAVYYLRQGAALSPDAVYIKNILETTLIDWDKSRKDPSL